MTKGLIWIVGFLTTSFLFIALSHARIININAKINNQKNQLEVYLEAGTYSIESIGWAEGGLYNAWNAWSSVNCNDSNGCPRTKPTHFKGWLNEYSVESLNIMEVVIDGIPITPVDAEPNPPLGNWFLDTPDKKKFRVDDAKVYPDSLSALSGAQTANFKLKNSGVVKFSIKDLYKSGNQGGISLNITTGYENHLKRLDVPIYSQSKFGGKYCSNDCSPVAGAMILGYWDSHGWPRMVPRGSADFGKNPDGVIALYEDLAKTMKYECTGEAPGTLPEDVAPGIIETASNMDPGAEFYEDKELIITTDNKDEAFDIIKEYINLGMPLIINVKKGFKYRSSRDGATVSLPGNHTMVITGYYADSEDKLIFLNIGLDPDDVGVADYNDLGLDLGSAQRQLWLNCVVPGGNPTPLAFPWVDLLLLSDEHK